MSLQRVSLLNVIPYHLNNIMQVNKTAQIVKRDSDLSVRVIRDKWLPRQEENWKMMDKTRENSSTQTDPVG